MISIVEQATLTVGRVLWLQEKQILLSNERDALKSQLEEATSSLSRLESEKAALFSEEADALRKSVSRRDEEVSVRGGRRREEGRRFGHTSFTYCTSFAAIVIF